jgi:hypothetical protein
MSEQSPDHDHANHAYEFLVCEHGEDWAVGMDERLYWEFKEGLRARLKELFDCDQGPWHHDLRDLTRAHGLRSLHEIPKRVHRTLLQGWLDRLNRKRSSQEQLFLSQELSMYCCYVPPKLWHACAEGEILAGSDAMSAHPLLIEATAKRGRRQRIPVYARAEWTCEITSDGRAETVDARSGQRLA